jgi:phosphoadenosine phosphosulfate reductase
MRPERGLRPVAEHVAELNARLGDAPAEAILRHALSAPGLGRVALVSSFGAESVALLHLVAQVDRATPVLVLDTGKLFAETRAYRADVARALGLRDVRVLAPDRHALAAHDPDGTLHRTEPDACCALRKTAPLDRALAGFDAWITGRKQAHGGARSALAVFEAEPGTGRIKVNPLARWTPADIRALVAAEGLPRHPLTDRGYPSIGCAPCTAPVAPGDDPRAGRWPGREKTECGIHIAKGRLLRRTQEGTP